MFCSNKTLIVGATAVCTVPRSVYTYLILGRVCLNEVLDLVRYFRDVSPSLPPVEPLAAERSARDCARLSAVSSNPHHIHFHQVKQERC